jgi:2-polyprenyl-6-methoxyphenol hydroxylase-like FAD-dependent oxidoreductase
MMPKRALIVGAGIGGLAAAVALRRTGWNTTVFEQAANPRELGFGLLLASNALKALDALGLAHAVKSAAAPTTAVEIRRLDGRLIRKFSARIGGSAVVALRPDLHGALLSAATVEAVVLSRRVTGFSAGDADVTVHLDDGSTECGDVLIGADGIHSVVRRQLHPEEPAPRPSGYCALRGVAHGATAILGDLSGVAYLDEGVEAAAVRAGRDAVYWYVSLLTQDIASVERTPAAIISARLGRVDPTLREILAATPAEDMRFDELMRRDPLKRWGEGRVTLLGDAAHPMLPHTGQGAAQALEDAVVLGELLGGPASYSDDRLRRYEAIRSRRTRMFVKLGPRIAAVTTTHSPVLRLIRDTGIRIVPGW